MHDIPSKALGLEFSPAVFRTLLKFWLGVSLTEEVTDGAAVCPFCDGPCDVFGDHALCRKKTELNSRHEAVVEYFTLYVRAAGLKVENDVQIGGRLRPADILLTRWACGLPFAGDVVVTHPLAPSLGLSSIAAAAAVRNKAARKKAKYSQLVAAHNIDFAPLALSSFGELGENCLEFISQVFYCAKQDLPRAEGEAQLRQQLSVALMRQVGQRLLAASPLC